MPHLRPEPLSFSILNQLDVLCHAFAVIQVPEAFAYMTQEDAAAQAESWSSAPAATEDDKAVATVSAALDVRYDVSVSAAEGGRNGGRGMRGIYLREAHETSKPSSFSCSVTPRLHEVWVWVVQNPAL